MIVQWCCKGVGEIGAKQVRSILTDGVGLTCRLWQTSRHGMLHYPEAVKRLSEHHLDLHVNHYDETDPQTGKKVSDTTPFISLSAGCVDRDVATRTNVIKPARRTALAFATGLGQSEGWLFSCYVIVAVNRAAAIPAVAEEVRDLNQLRRYSDYWTEGEVAAKINVPSRQIFSAEHWSPTGEGSVVVRDGYYINEGFVEPRALVNLRELL